LQIIASREGGSPLNADARLTNKSILEKSRLRDWFHVPDMVTENDNTGRYRRLSLTIQIFLIIMWTIHDIGVIMGFFYTPVLPGLSLVLALSLLVGVFKSIKLSNYFSLLSLNAAPFISVGILDELSIDTLTLSLMWIVWPLVFAIFLLGYRGTLLLVSLDFLGLFAFAVIDPDVSLDMLPLIFFFLLGASVIAISGSREREFTLSSLRVSESKYRQMVDLMPAGVVITDSDETILSANPAMATLLGRDIHDLPSSNFLSLMHPLMKERLLSETPRRNGLTSSYDLTLQRMDGESRDVVVYTAPLLSPSDEVEKSLRVFIDMSENKKLEKIQQQQHRELEIYASLLRHDLRNDLGIIIGNTEITQMALDEENSDILEAIASTQAVCERMLNLLKALSASSEQAETDIVALVQATAMKAQEIDPTLTVNVTVDPSVGSTSIDGMRLLPMVFDNLLRNASIHAGANPNVEIRILQTEDRIKIIISDNGPGIPEELRSNLFQKGVSSREGGGFGLYLAKEILGAIDGSIEMMDSASGHGAHFQVTIPFN
jgi:PAS domain S-box-containing protein